MEAATHDGKTIEGEEGDARALPRQPFTTVLAQQRYGALLTELTDGLAELVEACEEHEKGGTLTLKLTLKPAEKGIAGLFYVTDDLSVKAPVAVPRPQMMYSDGKGSLTGRDPRQPELPVRPAPAPAGEAK